VFLRWGISGKVVSVQNKVLVNIYLSIVSKPCCYPNGGGYKIKTQRICKKSEILALSS
jgi:hypothetical protein